MGEGKIDKEKVFWSVFFFNKRVEKRVRSFSVFKCVQLRKGEERNEEKKRVWKYKGKERSLKTTRIHLKMGDLKC